MPPDETAANANPDGPDGETTALAPITHVAPQLAWSADPTDDDPDPTGEGSWHNAIAGATRPLFAVALVAFTAAVTGWLLLDGRTAHLLSAPQWLFAGIGILLEVAIIWAWIASPVVGTEDKPRSSR